MVWRSLAILAICLAYANSFQNGFHFDDFHTVVDNPAIRSLQNVPRFFTDATTFSVLPENRTYRPIVSASLAFDYALGHGYKPLWFHLTTFLLFIGLIWSDRVNLRNLWVCCCRCFRRFSRTERAAVGADFSDD